MIVTLTRSQRSRLLALGLLALLACLLISAVMLPLTAAKREAQARIEEMRYRLDKYRGMAASRAGLEQQYAQAHQQRSVDDAYLNQKTTALAVAALQQIAKGQIASRGGRLISMQVNPLRQEEHFVRISINVKMRSSLENLVKLFHALENGRPALFLGQVMLRGLTTGSAQRGNQRLELDVRFDLAGYMKVDES
ncbi:MAG: type II secretion system protein GspM [Motiliproteus sp.]